MLITEFMAKTPKSLACAERARSVFPDGVAADTRLADPYGICIERALGTRKWDVDGNEYLDFFGGHGAMMLGHCHPRVTRAIQDAALRGVQFAASHPLEIAWGEIIQKYMPNAERVRFTASGTEATLLAIRIARAFTGRAKLIRIGTHYHGWHDFAVSGYNDFFDGAPAPGVLSEIARNTLLVPPGDRSALQAVLTAHASEAAALLIEPLGCHFGIVPTSDEFLREAFALAKSHGVPVILDEVITGFRVSPGGYQSLVGVRPDLTCLGKVAAGGMPGGTVCGSNELMSVLERRGPARQPGKKVLHQGTFTGNPLTASAALAMIDEVVNTGACEQANKMGELARSLLNETFRRANSNWVAYGRYSAFHVLPGVPSGFDGGLEQLPWRTFVDRSPPLLQSLRVALNLEGVDVAVRGTGFVSGIHQAQDVTFLAAAFESALARLRRDNLIP